jgi:hypothetical protein
VTLRHKWRAVSALLLQRAGACAGRCANRQVAVVAMMLLPTLILTPIGLGLMPMIFLVLGLLVLLWLIVQASLKPRFPAWLKLVVVSLMLVFVYTAMAAIASTYFGSSDRTCERLAADPNLMPIITRADIETSPRVESCFPTM